jgi:ATP-binding cassette, subfamily B, bacterial
MDEPTAALDARAEQALFSSVRRHAQGRSIVIITHRLASTRHADRIYVLSHGRVIEQGTHAELLALAGQYAELYQLQADQYQQGPVIPAQGDGLAQGTRPSAAGTLKSSSSTSS